MIDIGELIWVSSQPLIRLFICVATGLVLAKVGFLTAMASRSIGKIVINVAFPCLLFSRIIPAFSASNLSAIGPVLLVAVLYEAIGISISWTIKQVFWVPHRFRYGILVAGGWANVGDIPTSVLMSLTATAPFNGTPDENLAVAYIAGFVLISSITLFTLGGSNWIEMDFQGPDVADEDVREELKNKQKRLGAAIKRAVISFKVLFYQRKRHAEISNSDEEKAKALNSTLSDTPDLSIRCDNPRPSSAATVIVKDTTESVETKGEPTVSLPLRLKRLGISSFQTLIAPCSSSIILAFIISIVPPLKALFVPDVPGVNISPGPDGSPPLAVILNTAIFIGGASIPLGLMTLGSALARMEIPWGRLRSLPLGAIGALTIGRTVVMPLLGLLVVQRFTQIGLLDANNKVLRLVCIFMSCLPTSTAQVLLTQASSPTGDAQHLSVFLIPQYMTMFITMTALTAYTLSGTASP